MITKITGNVLYIKDSKFLKVDDHFDKKVLLILPGKQSVSYCEDGTTGGSDVVLTDGDEDVRDVRENVSVPTYHFYPAAAHHCTTPILSPVWSQPSSRLQ